jgi:branched-chain amino acid transport system substrate-binding protein
MRKNASAVLRVGLFVCLIAVMLVPTVSKAAPATGEPIKIGTIFSITGWAGFIGTPQKEIFTALIEDINAKGGIKGRPLEFYFEDDKSIPTNAVIAATKLIKDKKVIAMVGTSTTDSALAIVPTCEQEKTPFINSGPAYIPWKKWIFSTGPGDVRGAIHVLDFAVKDLGAKKIALMHGSDAYGMLGQKVIKEELPKYQGVTLVVQERFEPSDTNMIPQLTKIKAANPDLMILFTTGGAGAVVAKNYKQLGMNTKVLGSTSLTMPEFVKIAGSIADESNWIFLSQPMLIVEKMAANDPYRKNVYEPVKKIMQAKYGPSKEVTLFHGSSYDAIMAVVSSLNAISPNINKDSLRDAIEKTKVDGFLGVFGPTPQDHQGSHIDPMRPMMFKGGQFVPWTK